eukprot:4373736-Heterocapsa_arctica.AAC.1
MLGIILTRPPRQLNHVSKIVCSLRARSFLRQSDHLAPDREDIRYYLRAENTGYLSAARTALPL